MIKRNIVGKLSGSVLNKLSVNGTSILNGETQLSPNGGNVIWSWNTRYFGSTGNLSIGSQADNGFKLDVNGTTRLKGSVQIAPSGGDVLFSWNTRYFGATGNLSIGSQSDNGNKLQVNGSISVASSANITNGSGTYLNFNGTSLSLFTSLFNITGTVSSTGTVFSQNSIRAVNEITVGYSTNTANHSSAMFQLESNSRGFLPPRMTSAQRNAIASPATGLIVYQTDAPEGIYTRKSTGWVQGV